MKEEEEVKLHIYSADVSTELEVPFVDAGIKAGFPSPCLDYVTESIDLNKELIRHQETTFLARVSGHSLMEVGICDGDLVIVDKSLEASDGDYVVAYVDGDFTLKEFKMDKANRKSISVRAVCSPMPSAACSSPRWTSSTPRRRTRMLRRKRSKLIYDL